MKMWIGKIKAPALQSIFGLPGLLFSIYVCSLYLAFFQSSSKERKYRPTVKPMSRLSELEKYSAPSPQFSIF